MAEALARVDPVPTTPVTLPGVKISLAPAMQRYSLRARNPATLEKIIGAKLPHKIGDTIGDIACLGPDEWLWRSAKGAPEAMGEGEPVSIVDISDRSVCFILDGPHAAATLASGCPLDLDHFAVGRTTRTIYESVEIVIHRSSERRFEIEVWRSFAEWLWLSLTTAAAHP